MFTLIVNKLTPVLRAIMIFGATAITFSCFANDRGFEEGFKHSGGKFSYPSIQLLAGSPPRPIQLNVKRKTIIHFWATWCPPCVKELPEITSLTTEFASLGIDLIVVSVDVAGDAVVPAFLKKIGVTQKNIYLDSRSDLFKKLRGTTLPLSVVLDKDGSEIGRVTGQIKWKKSLTALAISAL